VLCAWAQVVALAPFLTAATLDYALLFVGGVMGCVSVRELGPEAWALDRQAALYGMVGGGMLMLLSVAVIGEG
jgi:zinc transporter ZupT